MPSTQVDTHLNTPTWFCIPPLIRWLTEARKREAKSLAPDVRSGINFSIILSSACFIEGALQPGVWALLDQKPDVDDPLCASLKDDLRRRLSREFTGAERYKELLELVVGVRVSDPSKVKPLWEGVVCLFHLRNLLAHGRAITHELVFPGDPNLQWHEEIRGATARARQYLLKKKLISRRPAPPDDEWFFLTDAVADHFWRLATDFKVAMGDSLSDRAKKAFRSATGTWGGHV